MGSTAIFAGRVSGRHPAVASVPSQAPAKIDALRLSLVLLMIMSISRIHQRFGLIAAFRPGLVLIGLAVVSAFVTPRGSLARWGWERRWQARVFVGITVACLGSIAFGISQGGALYFFTNYFSKVLIFAFLLMAAIRNIRDLWVFVWAYVIGAAVLVWMALFLFNLSVGLNGVARLDNLETWDANDICVLLLIGLGLSLLLYQMAGRLGRAALAMIIIGIGAAIARSGSRGGFLGLAAVVLTFLLSMQGTSVARRVGLVAVLAGGLAVAAPAGYWMQMNSISSVKSDYNWDADQGRRQLAIRGLQYMMDYPFFGVGASNFGRAEVEISEFGRNRIANGVGVKWSAVHNSYIEAGSEMGIPGLLLFSALTFGCIVSPWRLRRRIPREWERGAWEDRFLFHAARYFPIAAVGFAVPALFVSFAFLEPVYILGAMTAALGAFVNMRLREGKLSPEQPSRPVRGWRSLSARSVV